MMERVSCPGAMSTMISVSRSVSPYVWATQSHFSLKGRLRNEGMSHAKTPTCCSVNAKRHNDAPPPEPSGIASYSKKE